MIDKDLVRQRFQAAAATYEQEARVQEQVAGWLLEMLEDGGRETGGPGAGGQDGKRGGPGAREEGLRVLEIGCCTGLLSRALARRLGRGMARLYLNDLVPDFPALAAAGVARQGLDIRLLPGDIETLDLPRDLDLVVSSSTLHWTCDLPGLLPRLAGALRRGGRLVFSIYGPDNLSEIRQLTGLGLSYRDGAALCALLDEAGFVQVRQREERPVLRFATPGQALEHLRRTGVNALERRTWTPAMLRRLHRDYRERFQDPRGLPMSYHCLLFAARRP